MVYDKEVLEIFDRLKILESLYEKIRFVDPVKKKVLVYEEGVLSEVDSNCFNSWNKDKLCLNCISMRSYNENKTFMKMEHNLNDIYMLTSIPVKLADRNIVIELIKDASLSMGFEHYGVGEDSDMYKTIDNMNSILLKDSLTNIYNRRYINEILPVNIAMAHALNRNFSIIIADIDFFKMVNDTYGHLAGDTVLTEFSRIIESCLEDENGWVARYGGEEIMIGIPNSTEEDIVEIGELMRKSIEDNVFRHNDIDIKITASFGICNIKEIEHQNVASLIDCADKKLYLAKGNGRNKVIF